MPFLPPQPSAAWAHQEARSGFEVVYFQPHDDGHLVIGVTTAVEVGSAGSSTTRSRSTLAGAPAALV